MQVINLRGKKPKQTQNSEGRGRKSTAGLVSSQKLHHRPAVVGFGFVRVQVGQNLDANVRSRRAASTSGGACACTARALACVPARSQSPATPRPPISPHLPAPGATGAKSSPRATELAEMQGDNPAGDLPAGWVVLSWCLRLPQRPPCTNTRASAEDTRPFESASLWVWGCF